MRPVGSTRVVPTDEAGVRSPAPAESAIGAWTVEVSSRYKCIRCSSPMLELVHYADTKGYVADREVPLLCPACASISTLLAEARTIAKEVKSKEEGLSLLCRLFDNICQRRW